MVQAQRQFEKAFRAERTADMRTLLHAVAATDLGLASRNNPKRSHCFPASEITQRRMVPGDADDHLYFRSCSLTAR
jgi:hypothetical protein